jgi:hypothetical protein
MVREEDALMSLELGSKGNTEPTNDGIHIPRELFRDWNTYSDDPFPTFEALRQYAIKEGVWDRLQENIASQDWYRVLSTIGWALNSETILEMMLKTHFDIVNLALERTITNGKHIMIQGGKSATKGNFEESLKTEPDRASFLAPATNEGGLFVYCLTELDRKGSKKRQNIIPGEIKLYYKFRRDFLDATVKTKHAIVPDWTARGQSEQVFTQIYQYMNERHCAVGYLITDQELICVRRKRESRHGLKYGVMDIAPPIPLSIRNGELNAKLVLWYLHHKYAVAYPHLNYLPRTPKPG